MADKRRRHRIRDYKFTEQSHSSFGIASVPFGFFALVVFPVLVKISYSAAGEGSVYLGVLGIFAVLAAIVGLYLGIRGYRQEDTYHFFPKIGIFLSGLALIIWIIILLLGIFV